MQQSDKEKLSAVLAMCGQYNSLHPDTLFVYVQQAKMLSAGSKNLEYSALSAYYEALYNSKKGRIDTAMIIVDRNIADEQVMAMPVVANKFRLAKTGLLVRQNRLKEAMENALFLLHEGEKNNAAEDQIKAQIQIGWIYLELNQNPDALKWFFKALATNQQGRAAPEPSVLNSNIAAVYNNMKKNDSAIIFISKAIQQATIEQDLSFLCNSYYIYSDICLDLGNTALAEELLKKGVGIRKKIGDPFYTIADLAQLGKFYASINQYDKGIAAIKEGIAVAKENRITAKQLFLYTMLAENYKAANDLANYSTTLAAIVDLKDTLYSQNSAEAMSELQTKYEVQQKENTIIQQRFDLVQKTYWIYAAIGLLLFGGILWYINVKNNKRKQEQKMALALLEEKRLSEKAISAAQEKERKRIAADLHDNLGAYAAAISSNVDHISNDQKNENKVYEELKGNAQAIVSQLNDTIWVLTREELALIAISDRLKVFIQRLHNSYPDVRIDVNEKIATDHSLAPIQAFHLFKILQEAIINALKHSKCSEVLITIESNTHWKISINDNGNGLTEATKPATGGNGLHNMKNRAKESGWQIAWKVNEPLGTSVIISSTTN